MFAVRAASRRTLKKLIRMMTIIRYHFLPFGINFEVVKKYRSYSYWNSSFFVPLGLFGLYKHSKWAWVFLSTQWKHVYTAWNWASYIIITYMVLYAKRQGNIARAPKYHAKKESKKLKATIRQEYIQHRYKIIQKSKYLPTINWTVTEIAFYRL